MKCKAREGKRECPAPAVACVILAGLKALPTCKPHTEAMIAALRG